MPFTAHSAVTIDDLRRLAISRLPHFLHAPLHAGNGSARNVQRLRDRLLVPRALVDVSGQTQATSLFDREYADPFGISAIGYAGNYRPGADVMLAEAARDANVPFILSGGSMASIESIARTAPDHAWYQLYAAKDRSLTDHMMGRARDAGVRVLVFTVDLPAPPRVENILRTGVRPPARVPLRSLPYVLWELFKHPAWTLKFALTGGPPALQSWAPYAPPGANALEIATVYAKQFPHISTWHDLEHIRARWPGKLVVKGLLRAEDACRAADFGADAVTVSNHGSIKLDCMPASIDALPEIAAAVGRRIPVFFDGGLRSGADILVALCLGARFCFLGRPALYGVSAAGRPGVACALQILHEEVKHTMAMIGCPSIAELGPSWTVMRDSVVTTPGGQFRSEPPVSGSSRG